MGQKEVPEESVLERDCRGMISTKVVLVAMVCVRSTAVMRTRGQSDKCGGGSAV